jgi:hypothetical protein
LTRSNSTVRKELACAENPAFHIPCSLPFG